MQTLIIGIDLATKTTGVAFTLRNEQNHIYSTFFALVKNDGFSIKTLEEYYYNFTEKIINQSEKIIKQNTFPNENFKIKVGIEISNFKNPNLSMKFNFLGGMIVSLFLERFKEKVEFKTFNANEWFQFLARESKIENWNILEREFRKEASKKWASEKLKTLVDSDDLADAFGIAYFYDDCKDTIERGQFTRNAKKDYRNKNISKKALVQKYNREINSALNKMNEIQLMAQTKKIQDKTKLKLEALREKVERLNKEKKEIQNEKITNKI